MGSWPEPASSLMKRPPPWMMFFERCWSTLLKILRTWSQAATLKKSWALYSQIQGPHEKGMVTNSWLAFAYVLLLSCHPFHWWCVEHSVLHVACDTGGYFSMSVRLKGLMSPGLLCFGGVPISVRWHVVVFSGVRSLPTGLSCLFGHIRCACPQTSLQCSSAQRHLMVPLQKWLLCLVIVFPSEFTQAGEFCLLWMSNWLGKAEPSCCYPLEGTRRIFSSRTSSEAAVANVKYVTLSYRQML